MLLLTGADLEKAGKLYEAIQFYRKAVQLVPDIEYKLDPRPRQAVTETDIEHYEGTFINIKLKQILVLIIAIQKPRRVMTVILRRTTSLLKMDSFCLQFRKKLRKWDSCVFQSLNKP